MRHSLRSISYPVCALIALAAALAPAGATAKADCASDAGWHGFDVDRDRHIRVPVSVAGVTLSAVLDSGASRSVIDRAVAERLGLETRPGYVAKGLTETRSGLVAEETDVAVGQIAMPVALGVLDLSDVSRAAARPVEMVLGREIFAAGIVDIDFARNRIRFGHRGDCGVDESGAVTLPLEIKEGRYTVTASIEGLDKADFLIDLGSATSVYVSPDYAKQAGLLDGKRVSTGMTVGMEGLAVSLLSTLDTLGFAGIELKHVPMAVPARWNQPVAGVIGLPVLARFRMRIDAAGGKIRLTPRQDARSAPFPRDRSGLSTFREGAHLRILHVARNSPAELAGLRVNDRIIAIDGIDVPDAYPPGTVPIGRRPAGTKIALRTAAGNDHAITLSDYY